MANEVLVGQHSKFCLALFISSGTLFASLIWGTVGLGFLIYGKKQAESVPLFSGLALVAISYFIGDAIWMSVTAVGIIACAVWLRKRVG